MTCQLMRPEPVLNGETSGECSAVLVAETVVKLKTEIYIQERPLVSFDGHIRFTAHRLLPVVSEQ